MKLITIQHPLILDPIKTNDVHHADIKRTGSNLIRPYRFMMKEYGYKHCPIFACIVGKKSNFYGANTDAGIAIELNVPDEHVRIQRYYDWTDLIYMMEFPDTFQEEFPTLAKRYPYPVDQAIEKYGHDILFPHRLDFASVEYQATLEQIKAEWITAISYNTDAFDRIIPVLKPLNEYGKTEPWHR